MLRKIFIALTVLSFCLALVITLQNDRFSRENRQVEITVDHHEIQTIIRQTNADEAAYLRRLRELGVTSIALREDDLTWLEEESGTLRSLSGRELIWQLQLAKPAGGSLSPDGAWALEDLNAQSNYFLVFDETLAERIRDNMALKLGREVPVFPAGDGYILPVDFFLDQSFPVGIDTAAARRYREQGFSLVARPDNRLLPTAEAVETVLRRSLELDGVSTVVFDGPAVTGFPNHLEQTSATLKQAGFPVGIIKYITPQAGMKPLMDRLNYSSVLVHSNYYKVPPVLISGTVTEDNIRLLYIRFDMDRDNLAGEAERVLVPVTRSLQQRGYTFGPAAPIATVTIQPLMLLIVAIGGIVAPGLLLLSLLFPVGNRVLLILFCLGCLGLAGAVLLFHPHSLSRLTSLMAAALFPALAVVSQLLNRDAPLWRNRERGMDDSPSQPARLVAGAFFRATIISVAGGVITAALASQPYFLSGTAEYMGVKLAYTLPLIVIFIQALTVIGLGGRFWQAGPLLQLARRAWSERLQLRHLVFMVLGAVMLYLYITRSGHTEDMTIWAGEVKLRYFFMETLVVRPRFKELLVGHPLTVVALCLIAFPYVSRYRLLTLFALVAGAAGQISIVNSFSHWTTPLSVSLLRTANGLWIGLGLGVLAAVLVCTVINKLEGHEKRHSVVSSQELGP